MTNLKIAGPFAFSARLEAYGGAPFASKMGQPAGDHFVSMISRPEDLPKLSKTTLWEGAQIPLVEFA